MKDAEMRKVNGMTIPETLDEYEVWGDERICRHFRVKGSVDDMLLEGWIWWEFDDKHKGMVLIRRFDGVNRKHSAGFCSPNHPLVVALGLGKS
jgi:hypothetical protein